MDFAAFRKVTSKPGDTRNYVACYACIMDYYSTSLWNRYYARTEDFYWSAEIRRSIPRGWELIHTDGLSLTCWRCHEKIKGPEFSEFHSEKKSSRPKRWRSKRVTGSDTRRINAAGKLIGGNHRKTWHSSGIGKYYKTSLHKAERAYWKRYARAYTCDPEIEPHVRSGSMVVWASEVSWNGT